MPALLILIYYFGVPARFIYKRCAQLIFNEDSFLNIVSTDSDFMDDIGADRGQREN